MNEKYIYELSQQTVANARDELYKHGATIAPPMAPHPDTDVMRTLTQQILRTVAIMIEESKL